MQAYYTMTKKIERARLFSCMVLFIRFCGALGQQYGNPYNANAYDYVENSVLSSELENKTFTILTVHSDNVYAAGINGLFHLTQNLELESKHVTEGEENIYKILEVSESLGKLVACSSGGKRGCQLRNLDDVSVNSSSTNAYFHENIVAPREYRTVGKIAPGKSGGISLYVARSIDLNGADRANRPIFEREIMSSGNDDRQTNVITSSVQDSFVIYYSDVFSYDGFVYYLASQRDDSTKDSPIVSKLSRICQNDESSDFKAFVELQLSCKGDDGSPYSITQSAHRIGNDLYIVFNKNGDKTHEYNPQSRSALCVYNMTDIEEKFAANSEACACYRSNSEVNSNIDYLSRASCGTLFEQFGEDFAGCDSLGIENLRSKFTCSGELGSTRFFAYPDEPRDQEVPAETLYEDNYTFTSVSVTSVPRDDSQRIAFIGTKEGKLLKINIDLGTNYEVVHVGSPILSDTTLYNNNESLLILTETKLLKIKVADCSRFTNCVECIRPGSSLGDPFCGWCTLERRCTRKDHCTSNDDIARWLPYDELHCPTIEEVIPNALPRDDHSRQLQLRITNLPDLKDGESFECHFNEWNTTAIVTEDFTNCTSPPLKEIPVIVSGDHVTMQLRIFSSETGKAFITKDYEFYDCSRIGLCYECVNSPWKCDWCKFEHRCTHDSSGCRKTIRGSYVSPLNASAESCPQILPGEKKLVPNGVERSFQFQAKNLPPLEDDDVEKYECHLKAKDNCCAEVDFVTKARLNSTDGVLFNVTCDPIAYSYMKSQQTLETKLSLKWNKNNEVDNFQEVQLYKCEVNRPDCSRCLSPATAPENLRCVWCENTCTAEDTCDVQPTLPVMGTCPPPRIDSVHPVTSTLGGGTHVTITGSNLGQSFQDIRSIILAGEVCLPLEDSFRVGESITCEAGPATEVKDSRDILVQVGGKSGTKPNCFSYKDPHVSNFSPNRGPQSGGTILEIAGEHLDTGGFVDVSIGGVPCILLSSRTAEIITCRIMAAQNTFASRINVTFDQTESKFSENQYSFEKDPTIESVAPLKSIVSGGLNLTVTGKNFDLIQLHMIIASSEGREIASMDCWMQTSTELQCPSPSVKFLHSRKKRQTGRGNFIDDVVIGFRLDGVSSLQNWTADNDITFQYFEDPKYFPFEDNETIFSPDSQDFLQLQGENLDLASRQEDVTVYIGRDECIIEVLDEEQLYCRPPKNPPDAGDLHGNKDQRGIPFVVVHHGLNLRFDIGYVRYPRNNFIYVIISVCFALVLFLFIVGMSIKCASRSKKKQVDKLLMELDNVKTNVSKELKIFYDTLQTALDNFEYSRENMVGLKMTDRKQYVLKFLFHSTNMQPNDFNVPQNVMGLQEGMETFSELINTDNFLIDLIRAFEDDSHLSAEQRSSIASLIVLSFLLERNVRRLAHVLKILMAEKIDKADQACSHHLFLGNGNILDRLILNMVAIGLCETLSIEIADKILELFTAIKCIIEAGPIDAVTGKSQFSLSFSHMLESQIEFNELTLNVLFKDECDHVVGLSFLSVDSITQVKTKILDYFSRDRLAQLEYKSEQFDLVLCKRKDEDRVLKDDGILQLNSGWRKINTLSDYEVKDGACVELVRKLNNSTSDKNIIREVRPYSYADVDDSCSGNDKHLEGANATTVSYVRYLVPDEGYLEPDMNQAGTILPQESKPTPDDGKYLTPKDKRENDEHDSLSESAVKYYYPDKNPENDEHYSLSESAVKYYYPYENPEPDSLLRPTIKHYYPDDQRKISAGDIDPIYDEPEKGYGLWVWHLMKNPKSISGGNTASQADDSDLEDIVRPYLPATGSVLQKYVRNVFDAFMNATESHVSCVVKDLFDFFDRKAAELKTPELSNTWKSNVFFLRIYSSVLTKPTIICDVEERSYVQACLAVIDQTMAEICSDGMVEQDDLRGKLFSQLVPVYRAKLDEYYKQVTRMKTVDNKSLEKEYAKVEKVFVGSYNLLSVQYQLYTMVQNHINQVCEKSQDDLELIQKVQQMQSALKIT